MNDILIQLGLTKNESIIYLTLLEKGEMTSGGLIKETGFQNSVVYHLLNQLMEKGFVNYVTEKQKKSFRANDPRVLRELIQEKEKDLEAIKKEYEKVLPHLEMLQNNTKDKQNIAIFKGKRGIQTIQNDILEHAKGEYHVFSAKDCFKEIMPKYYELFKKIRIEKKIKQNLIICGSQNRKPNHRYQDKRYIDKEYHEPFSILLWDNKVAFNIWNADPLYSVMIENKAAYTSFMDIFQNLWDSAKEYKVNKKK